MNQAAENAPLFIEAFYDACKSLPDLSAEFYAPDVAAINALCLKHNIGYEIQPPYLVLREDQANASSNDDRSNMILRNAVLEKEKNRYRLLLALYEITTERGECSISRPDIVQRSGLDPDAARAAENYLEGAGLLEVMTIGPKGKIEITHPGIVEIEKHLKKPYPSPPDSTTELPQTLSAGCVGPTNQVGTHPLKVFLCHSSGDKPAVRELYYRLRADGINPWLDEENLLPGQVWQQEIPKAVRDSDVVIVCLSQSAINKSGYVQKEIKYALDIADEQPEGTIFLIPVKLEECDVPDRLSRWQWVNLFDEKGYQRLMLALNVRASRLQG